MSKGALPFGDRRQARPAPVYLLITGFWVVTKIIRFEPDKIFTLDSNLEQA
jgi:hypothetical protein